MKKIFTFYTIAAAFLGLLSGCDKAETDEIPQLFHELTLKPDDIYMYNPVPWYGIRLDPLLNDSIKVNVNVSYSEPLHGEVNFIENEGFYYTPEPDFFGIDSLVYTVCSTDANCASEKIRLIVEEPLDWDNCTPQIIGEYVETTVNTPIEIRIFLNDVICLYNGTSIWIPQKGTFNSYSYTGSYKNTVYVYYPPKNYRGSDSFKYRIYLDNNEYIEAVTEVVIL